MRGEVTYPPPMAGMIDRGGLRAFGLRFDDAELEAEFQESEGALGLAGYRIITGATVVLWIIAIFVFPLGTDIDWSISILGFGLMAVAGAIAFFASGWAVTMNRQHALATMLTSANGLVLLMLAWAGDAVRGYAVAAILLLFMFGFVSRTRFVFAMVRTGVIAVGVAVVVWAYQPPRDLALDVFIFIAASVGSLLGLRMIERNRRRTWHQTLVIEEQRAAIDAERAQSDRLLLNVLPVTVSQRLKEGENPIADDFTDVSVLFADIVGFTTMTSSMAAHDVITMLSDCFSMLDELVVERGLEKIKTIGDSYMVVGGLPDPIDDHAVRMVDLARAILASRNSASGSPRIDWRIGIHSGPVAGGVIGTQKFAYDVWGNTVNIAARIEEAGVPGRIHVSEETMRLTSSVYDYEKAAPTVLRGVGPVTTYLLTE